MTQKKRRQLELGLAAQGKVRSTGHGAARTRRQAGSLDLGYARLQKLYELGKLLRAAGASQAAPEALRCLGESVPLRVALLVEAREGAASCVALRARGVPDQEVELAAAHARSCLSRLSGGLPAQPGPLQIHPEPLPPAGRAGAPGRSPFAALPLLVDGREVCGALYVRGARPLGEADLAFLSAAADQISLAWDGHAAWQREVRLRERAEALDRAQKDLVAVVSHDLRNPLGAVLIGIQTLRRWPRLDPARLREHLDTLQRAAERASNLVHDLLDVARLDAGHLPLDLLPLDLGELVRESAELFRPLLEGRSMTCETEVAEALPPVLGDRERLLQVFSNLMGNARKFGRDGSTLSVAAWQEDGEARCRVSDQGPGISARDLPHIFDRYFQGEHGPAAHGVGLGLSIVRGIVEAHGGRLWVESAEGQGSSFFFTLPLAAG